jgi:inner membrane transporter RhtA
VSANPLTRVPAFVLVLGAILSVQFGAGLARTQFDAVGPLGATFLRLFFGATILLLILRPKLGSWGSRKWLAATVLGVALAGMNTMIYLAFESIPLGVAVTIEFLGPLVLSLALSRRIVDVLWALLALAGVVLLGLEGFSAGSVALVGLLFAAGAGAFWALYILSSARVGREIAGLDGLAVALAIAAVISAPFGLAGASRALGSPHVLLIFVGVAILSSVLPYALEMMALRRLPTRVFGILSSLGPAAAALAGLVVLGESLGWREIVALLLVMAASVGVTLARGRKSAQDSTGDAQLGSAGERPVLNID